MQKVNELFHEHDLVIMTGGAGLYIKAFCEGLDEMPGVPEEIKTEIIFSYEKYGLNWLQKEIKQKDSAFYRSGEIQNPQRLMRALEITETTGKSILDFRKGKKKQRNFNIVKMGLELPKEELHQNIDARVNKMMEAGLVEEVRNLLPSKNLNALQTVGYSEIFDYLEGKVPLEEAIADIKKHTRQYAKRQITWFKKDKEIKWFNSHGLQEIKKYLDQVLL